MAKAPYIPRSIRSVELRTPRLPHEPAYQEVPLSAAPAPAAPAWESFVIPLPFRKYAGKTLRQVLTEDPRYMRWLYSVDLSRHPDLDEMMEEMVDAEPLMFEEVIDPDESMFFAAAALAPDGRLHLRTGIMRRDDNTPFQIDTVMTRAKELLPESQGFQQHTAEYQQIPKPGGAR